MKNNSTLIIVVVVAVALIVIFMMMNKQQAAAPTTVVQQPQDNLWTSLGGLGNLVGALGIGGGGGSYQDDPNFTGPVMEYQSQEMAAENGFKTLIASVEGTELNP